MCAVLLPAASPSNETSAFCFHEDADTHVRRKVHSLSLSCPMMMTMMMMVTLLMVTIMAIMMLIVMIHDDETDY